MSKITVFNFITLNGFYKDDVNDINWHQHGDEEADFSTEMLKQNNILLFGRITYEMMASFWPTEMALSSMPKVAQGMNAAEKYIISKSLKKAEWINSTIVDDDLIEWIKKIKLKSKKDITILGSGTIVAQLAEIGLIDTYQIMIDPIAIGKGSPIFSSIKSDIELRLTNTRVFKSGSVLLCYEPKTLK